jgi:hypothetical protein
MIKKIFTILILITSSLYLVLNFFVIGNDRIKFIKEKVPNHFGWKETVKKTFFSHIKNHIKNNEKSYIIRTDGNHSFKLNENNNLFFYSNVNNEIEIEITGILNDKEIQCHKTKILNSVKINLNEFNKNCKSAIYFIGKIDKQFFYFGFEQEKNNSKNLLVLPSTNFFLYTNNIFNISPYEISEDFIINLNNIPINPNDVWASKISQSIHNISNIVKDYEIILDYEFQNYKLDEYNLIILPLHQEYVSDDFIENLLSFLNKENKAVLSIGGANFMRDFELINNDKIIIKKNELKDTKYYNLNTFDNHLNKNCLYLDDNKIIVSEITEPLVNKNIEYFFPKIKCDNDKIIPLLSIQNFNNTNNSKLIHILSDGIGINFTKIDYLKSKILSELNNILRN